jgi:hypothetical protein
MRFITFQDCWLTMLPQLMLTTYRIIPPISRLLTPSTYRALQSRLNHNQLLSTIEGSPTNYKIMDKVYVDLMRTTKNATSASILLLKLPGELPNRMYDYYFQDMTFQIKQGTTTSPLTPSQESSNKKLSLLKTSCQIYSETHLLPFVHILAIIELVTNRGVAEIACGPNGEPRWDPQRVVHHYA